MSEHTRTTRDVEFFFVAGMTTAGTRPHIARVEFRDYLAAHDAQVRAEALREYAALVEEIATLGPQNTGLRTPEHLAEYTRNYADRIEQEGAGQ